MDIDVICDRNELLSNLSVTGSGNEALCSNGPTNLSAKRETAGLQIQNLFLGDLFADT
jgi:hypothetical protein